MQDCYSRHYPFDKDVNILLHGDTNFFLNQQGFFLGSLQIYFCIKALCDKEFKHYRWRRIYITYNKTSVYLFPNPCLITCMHHYIHIKVLYV